jgi:uncharacterized protein
MLGTDSQQAAYITELTEWRHSMDERLRAEDGWLTLVGLYWLHEGINTIGIDASSDIPLQAAGIPPHLGVISFENGQATLQIHADVDVMIDGESVRSVVLRDDTAECGPSRVSIGSITFFVIRRGDEYGIRVRDANNPARQAFKGRRWFPVDLAYRVTGTLIAHHPARSLSIMNSSGQIVSMSNHGRVEFTLQGQQLSLEAFSSGENQLWFVFKDETSSQSTYGAGRFLVAPIEADGSVVIDFNRAYHPPCAFTEYATCPYPPKENTLPVGIMVGERL